MFVCFVQITVVHQYYKKNKSFDYFAQQQQTL